MSIHEFLSKHSSEEITELMAYCELEAEASRPQPEKHDAKTIASNFRRLSRKKSK